MLRANQVFWQNKRPTRSQFDQMKEIFSDFDLPAFSSGTCPRDYVFVASHHEITGHESVLGGIVFRIKNFCAEIVAIGVRRSEQRRRIGTSLVQEMEQLLVQKSVRRIEAKVPNDSRRAFYKFLGFKEYNIDRMDRWIPRTRILWSQIRQKVRVKRRKSCN